MQKDQSGTDTMTRKQMLGLMTLAYLFSFLIRMIWVYQFQDNPNFIWNNELMINTNDGYFFASGVQQALWGMHETNERIPEFFSYGVVFLTALFVQLTPFNIETVILYMPAVVSSLVVIPVILIARLYQRTLWGFFAALLGSIAWSYYNRTMIGYYDTDMFSAMAPMFIVFFLMKSTIDFNIRSGLYAALAITVYPFLYDQGRAVVYAMGLIYAAYMLFYHRKEDTTYHSLILLFIALLPFSFVVTPWSYLVKLGVLGLVFVMIQKVSARQQQLIWLSAILFVLFMIFGNVFELIFNKVTSYIATGTKEEGLHFYSVTQTVREAGKIPFEVFANRISGSQVGVFIAFAGYIAVVIRYRTFLLALPLVGIGMFALWGGLRFTVYAVPMAAIAAVFLFGLAAEMFIKEKKFQIVAVALGTVAMIYPNITHIIDYKVPTVLNHAEVQDLVKLNEISDEKDYTITWWDYGYPIWFYSETNTIIDGGKHSNDNFIASTVLQTDSSQLAANLSRLAVETYVSSEKSGKNAITDTLFKNRQQAQLDPNLFLKELQGDAFKLPSKTRDIYLYLPYRMMQIFPTVMLFGNLDLITGEKKRKTEFYPTAARKQEKNRLYFANGLVFDMQSGELDFGKQKKKVKAFVVAQIMNNGETKSDSQLYHMNGGYIVVFLKSYGQFVIMDEKTYKSTYVQMFMLGNYDKTLFEPVISSPYSKIYKLKR